MSIKKVPDTGEQSEWDKKTEGLRQEQFDSESFCPASPLIDGKSLDRVCLNLRTPGNLECSWEAALGERRLAAQSAACPSTLVQPLPSLSTKNVCGPNIKIYHPMMTATDRPTHAHESSNTCHYLTVQNELNPPDRMSMFSIWEDKPTVSPLKPRSRF